MNNSLIKNQLSLLKNKRKAETKLNGGFIKYKDIIAKKIQKTVDTQLSLEQKESKKEEPKITKESPLIKSEELFHPPTQKTPEKEETQSLPKEKPKSRSPSPKKKEKSDYVLSIVPSEIIQELKEQDSVKRIIEVDKFTYDFKCEQLYNWFHLTFLEWEKELEELISQNSEELKSRMGVYKQCRGYIKTLLINLKDKKVSNFILDKLFQVMVFCIDGDYISAHANYLELSIGNAPWPMGVTMVGIHERSGRSKIYTSQVAHILNDDITKKYLQSVKRVMTFIQRRYPKSPSKCVFS